MFINDFNEIVLQSKNSVIAIGAVIIIVGIIAVLAVEIYVRQKLKCRYFHFGKIKLSPTLLMCIPLIISITTIGIQINKYNLDIANASYETYIGYCTYKSESVRLQEKKLSIYVGKGHMRVPHGTNYGKCIYSKRSKVIVYWEPLEVPQE